MKIKLVGTYSKEFEQEIKLTSISCREISGLSRRPYMVEITTSKHLKSKPFSIRESNNGVRTFHITLSGDVTTLALQELMPKIFSSICRRVLGTSKNFNRRIRNSYDSSLITFGRLLGV